MGCVHLIIQMSTKSHFYFLLNPENRGEVGGCQEVVVVKLDRHLVMYLHIACSIPKKGSSSRHVVVSQNF